MKGFVSYKFIDADGCLRDKIVAPALKSKGRAAHLEDTWFDGSSFGLTQTECSDLRLVPDADSIHYDPIRKMDSVFCFLVSPDGSVPELCFRSKAKEAMCEDEQTREALFGVEPEFFIIVHAIQGSKWDYAPFGHDPSHFDDKNLKQGDWYGCLPPLDNTQHIRDEVVKNLNLAGLEVESHHHEVGAGQAEISWRCDNLLRTADKLVRAKYIIEATARQFFDDSGRMAIASFDPKPFKHLNGSGCHTHISIPKMNGNIDVVHSFAQGLVDHYDDLLSVCNTDPHSCNRLIKGFEAPTKENNGYGWCDRTKTVRIVADQSHLEYRLPDCSMNPYVALSAMLKYGYDKVKENEKDISG